MKVGVEIDFSGVGFRTRLVFILAALCGLKVRLPDTNLEELL